MPNFVVDNLNFKITNSEDLIVIEASDQTKRRWKASVDEKEAGRVTLGLYEETVLTILCAMLVEAFQNTENNKKDVDVFLTFSTVEQALTLTLFVKEKWTTRKFTIRLLEQEVDPLWRLEQMIFDRDEEIRKLRLIVENLEPRQVINTLTAQCPTVDNPQAVTDVAKILLPVGKWVLQFSFFISFPGADYWLYYNLMYGAVPLPNQGNNAGTFFNLHQSNVHNWPTPVSGMAIVEANGNSEVYLRFSPYKSAPRISNIVLVAQRCL